jgi:long-chain acyl-CoA synthetase
MIISGGENVYPAEVESVLLCHRAVAEAAVFGVPSERWGEEVRAVVVLNDGEKITSAELVEHCREAIGGYKVPKVIDISAEPLPKTGPGKIAKTLLRETYWKRAS